MRNTRAGHPLRKSSLLRFLALIGLTMGLFATGTGSAGAAEACTMDGYSGVTIVTDKPTTPPGTDVVISGTGYGPPGCELTITADGQEIGKVIVDENGEFSLVWSVASDHACGEVEIASVADGETLATTTMEIVDCAVAPTTAAPAPAPTDAAPAAPPADSGGGALPATGAKTLPFVIGGLVLFTVGAVLLVMANRRRTAAQR